MSKVTKATMNDAQKKQYVKHGEPKHRVILRFKNDKMCFTLTPYQVNRLKSGCSTVPFNKRQIQTAFGHSYMKENCGYSGDTFVKEAFMVQGGEDDFNGLEPIYRQTLTGPTSMLREHFARFLTFRMPKPVPIDFSPHKKEEDLSFLSCVYDPVKGYAFVDENGNVMLVAKDQIWNMSKPMAQCT